LRKHNLFSLDIPKKENPGQFGIVIIYDS